MPEDVQARLLKGLGAYVRSTARPQLPAPLRRFAGFRQQALARHRHEVLSALERDDVRARLLEWLDAVSNRVGPGVGETLRAVCEHDEGWLERVSSSAERAPPEPAGEGPNDLDDAVARERDRARRAQQDARRARAEARRSVEEERARTARMATEIEDLRAGLEEARRELQATQAGLAKTELETERAVRRARRERDRERARAEALRAELKAERRRAKALAREAADRARDPGREQASAAAAPTARPGRRRKRRPLDVPRGRLADDVDTLDEWLLENGVRVLVDGYNVTKAPGGFGGLDLPRQRERLVEELERLGRRRGVPVTIVFDGSEVPPGVGRRRRGVVDVQYSRPTESADDHLVAALEGLPLDPVVVVTNDRDLQERVKELGATVASARQLLALIR